MLYCAYGSNCNLEQMAFRCPNSKVVCNGKLKGYKLVFNVHADVIKTNKEHDEVPVVVWNIADEDWHKLDMYEGYPTYYGREIIDVVLDGGKTKKAMVYTMTKNRKGICPPQKNYFDCILKGYNDNGIDVECLYKALEHSYENEMVKG